MSNKGGKTQLSEEEIKEREMKKFANNVSLLIKSVNNITNYLIDKGEDELSPKELRTVFEAVRPTVKNIVAINKSKQNSKGGRSGKAKRDPNMPKKPPSPYFLFCGKMRPIVSKKDSTLHPQQVVTELGKLWKELPEDQKEKYKIEAEKQKAIYDEKMKEYLASIPSDNTSSSEEDEVESEGDSDEDKKKKSGKAAAKSNPKKRKSTSSDGSSKKVKSDDEKKKKLKSNPKKAVTNKQVKKKGAKVTKKEEESSDDSTDSSSDSD